MKLFRVLRMLDDLAEVLIFDHLLATKFSRRLACIAVSPLVLAAYVSSGFWMSPAPLPPASAQRALSALERPALPAAHVDLAAQVVRARTITSAQDTELRRVLDSNRRELERYTSVAGDASGALHAICQRTGTVRVSGVATLLCARGLLFAREGLDSSAVMDWITVLRLGNALSLVPPADKSDLSAHVVGGVLENTAVRLLSEHLRTRDLEPAESAEIARTLSSRTSLTSSLCFRFERESDELAAMLRNWAQTNQLPAACRGLRFYLPVVAASRRTVAARMIARIDDALHEIADRAQTGAAIPPRPPFLVTHVAGWAVHLGPGTGWSDRLATLWSNERAADLAARLILCWRSTRLEDYARTCQGLEAEAQALSDHCLSELQGS